MFEKKNPAILFNKVYKENPHYEFNTSSIFLFTLFDQNTLPINDVDKKLHIYIQLIDNDQKRVNDPLDIQNFDLVKCDSNRFQNISNFLHNPIENYYCNPKNLTYGLNGIYGIGAFKYLRVQIDICKNTTENGNNCYYPDYIRQNLPSVFNFHYIFFDSYMDGYNYTNPEVIIV